MFWNPRWNETLYIASCADRLLGTPDPHCQQEILQRIKHDIHTGEIDSASATQVQFRLLLIKRVNAELITDLIFISRCESLNEAKAREL